MRRIISLLFSVFIICFFSVIVGCNSLEKSGKKDSLKTDTTSSSFSYIKDGNLTYDKQDNIVLCNELPCFGYIELAQRIVTNNTALPIEEKYYHKSEKINEILNCYRKATDNSDYLISDYGEGVAIVKYLGESKNLVIPSKLENKKVIKLGGYIEKNVSNVDISSWDYHSAIDDKDIVSITIPKTVKEIPLKFFSYMYSEGYSNKCTLQSINVDEDNPYYSSRDGLLYNKDKTVLLSVPVGFTGETVKIPEGVETAHELIGKHTKNLIIPSSLKRIRALSYDSDNEEGAFCTFRSYKLENIEVSRENKYYASESGVLYNNEKTRLILYPSRKKTNSFTVPDSVRIVEYFNGNNIKHLKKMIFGKGIENIDMYCNKYNAEGLNIIEGYKGTAAEKYAKKNGFKFIALD